MSEVKGFKVFNPDWTCNPDGKPYQYTCPGTFEIVGKPIPCEQGFHFCKKASDCFKYYDFNPDNKVAEVIALGTVIDADNKSCTNEIQIVREIPWAELLTIVNEGKSCTGLCNTGDWNKTCFSSGVFCTEEPKILLFNKPSVLTYRGWRNSRACGLLNQIDFRPNMWIWESDMTDDEKAAHPEYKTVGGFLKVLDTSDCCKRWWDSLTTYDRKIICTMPNFDPAIFKEITGIDVTSECLV